MNITREQLLAFRIERSFLGREKARGPEEVATRLCGVQAQLQPAAELAIALRCGDAGRQEVHDALYTSKTLIKTSSQRQTLHFLPAKHFTTYIKAQKAYRLAQFYRSMDRIGISEIEYLGYMKMVTELLRAEGPLTRSQITASIRQHFSPAMESYAADSWGPFRGAVMEGRLCYGPSHRGQVTFIPTEEWRDTVNPPEQNDALVYLLSNYLKCYGPASRQDFSHWMGMPQSLLENAWVAIADELIQLNVGEETLFLLRKDQEALETAHFNEGNTIHLIPHFDCYLLAHRQKDTYLAPGNYKKVYKKAGWIAPSILHRGQVIGTWRYNRMGSGVKFERSYFSHKAKLPVSSLRPFESRIREYFNS